MREARPDISARILVVEDEAVIALNLVTLLRGLGHDVLGAVTYGERALEMAAEECPDLVLMDIKLRGELDGIETAERMMSQRHVPVIFLTAHGDRALMERASRLKHAGYLKKPFEEAALRQHIEAALNG
jgi:CheY-like chemotaxis protein